MRDEAEFSRMQSVAEFGMLSPMEKQEKIMQMQANEKGNTVDHSKDKPKLKRYY